MPDAGAVVAVAPPADPVAVVGSNVASNGERIGVGKTTGTLLSVTDAEVLPNSTLTVPVA